MQGLVLIKLGGSVITFKDRPLTANVDAINGISRALNKIRMPTVIVHGGGSFGHYWSVQYGMHTKPARYDTRGISVVHESMMALNQIIVNSMIKEGLCPYGMPPSVFTAVGHKPITPTIKMMSAMAKSNVLPVTFGDIVHVQGSRYSILSGDVIMTILAKVLRPSKVIFATNVDGVYKNMIDKNVVHEIKWLGKKSIKFLNAADADVTGGMQRKIAEAFKIASNGMDVLLVNGLVPDRIVQAAGGTTMIGTVIKRRKA
jgi:isopentenyl phosphate kinase